MKSININVTFPKEYQLNRFINMLAWMELCGNVGHFTDFVVAMDGDGNARPKFTFDDSGVQKQFDELRKSYAMKELSSIPNYKTVNNSYDISFLID